MGCLSDRECRFAREPSAFARKVGPDAPRFIVVYDHRYIDLHESIPTEGIGGYRGGIVALYDRNARPSRQVVPAPEDLYVGTVHCGFVFGSHLGKKRKRIVELSLVKLPSYHEFHEGIRV